MINWGIIGCGDVTEVKSGLAFNKVPGSSLVAVMRRDAAKAKDYAQRHGVPKWHADAQQLINDPAVNAVYVATPPSSHLQYTLAAIAAGKPVYVEKPMSTDAAAALQMAAAANTNNVKLTVAHYRRQQPFFQKIKEQVDTKAIGAIRQVKLELNRPALTTEELSLPGNQWRINPAVAGGGFFHDLAPHQVTGSILFNNGTMFSGNWCFAAPNSSDHCEIIGTHGRIQFAFFSGNTITLEKENTVTQITFDLLQHVQQPMIAATVNYFLGHAANPCSGEEGAEVMRIMGEMVGR
jgi:predicted dehydrogenase